MKHATALVAALALGTAANGVRIPDRPEIAQTEAGAEQAPILEARSPAPDAPVGTLPAVRRSPQGILDILRRPRPDGFPPRPPLPLLREPRPVDGPVPGLEAVAPVGKRDGDYENVAVEEAGSEKSSAGRRGRSFGTDYFMSAGVAIVVVAATFGYAM
ncbi:hypothetical protein QBC44DRAFT_305807 [Cladorrhinum sp. PSN332]|nr:hypothetical protein QBC44DRAFT_305807 [Cladorrhinum sp. PSN332]